MGEHLLVRAALRQLRHADPHDARRRLQSELGDRGREHLTLSAVHVMIVERNHQTPIADGLSQP